MPIYDVRCSQCRYEGTASIKIAELTAWDQSALCPNCAQNGPDFRRIIKMAPGNLVGGSGFVPSKTGKSGQFQKKELSSSEKDDMRHREFKRRDSDQVAAAVENVKKGAFEGF